MKKQKVLILIAIGALAFIYIRKVVKLKASANNTAQVPTTGTAGIIASPTTTTTTYDNNTVLKYGMNTKTANKNVVQWSQSEINKVVSKLGISKLVEDGIFGTKTKAAFQKLLGKSTGSYSDVYTKVQSLLGANAIQNSIAQLQGSNTGFKV